MTKQPSITVLPDGTLDIYSESAIDLYAFTNAASPLLLSDGATFQKTVDFISQAKRFTLDGDSTLWLINMARENAQLIHDLKEFALAPHAKMAVEFEKLVWHAPFNVEGVLMLFVAGRKLNVGFFDSANHRFLTQEELQGMALFTELCRLTGLAMFLAFAGRKVRVLAEIPGKRTLSRRKMQYFSRSKITIDLLSPRQLRRALKTHGTHATPRRHEVMGHFVHRGGWRGCEHSWEPLVRDPDDGVKRWECSSCARKRTWRKAFERGDAGKGFVRQKYEITAKGDGDAAHPQDN